MYPKHLSSSLRLPVHLIFLLVVLLIQSCQITNVHADSSNGNSGNNDGPIPNPNLVGGTITSPTRYPYLASVIVRSQEEMNHHTCGAMLIAPDLILTAAHCPPPLEGVEIGRYNIDPEDGSEVLGSTYGRFLIEEELRHPNYCPSDEARSRGCVQREFDFMIMKLYGRTEERYIIINTDENMPSDRGQSMTVLGWGMIDEEVYELSEYMREIEVNYIPNEVCKSIRGVYEGDQIVYSNRATPRVICAADVHETDDSCYGDSGGPLIHKGGTVYEDRLLGIVSYGWGCAERGLPGIYARVSSVAEDWLIPQICRMSAYPPSHYNCPYLGDDISNMVPARIVISFDDKPQDTGWVLKELESGKIYSYAPIGMYGNGYRRAAVEVTVDINAGRTGKTYTFALLDWSLNGMRDYKVGSYEVYVDDYLVAYGSGRFEGNADEHTFFVAAPPTPEPTPMPTQLTEAPTTMSPTLQQTSVSPSSSDPTVASPTELQTDAKQVKDSSGAAFSYNACCWILIIGAVALAVVN